MRPFYRPCHARCHNRLIAMCCNANGRYAVNCQIHANANDAAG
ncbi:hypothetical protein XaFJ1_GM002158 [Xanthomonas albilineans]|nr:hypothetical protein XaFJ1_GM002158 [Xanthomonas albilineans]